MKAVFSWTTHFGIDKIRMSCGGQGYNDYSGLPSLWRMHSAIPTVEGENTMIILQCSRFILKNFRHVFEKGDKPVSPYLEYLRKTREILVTKHDIGGYPDRLKCP